MNGAAFGSWPVADDRGFLGMLRATDVISAIGAGHGSTTVGKLLEETTARADGDAVAHVHSDHPLGLALARMGQTRHAALPVVSRGDARLLVGIVTLPDILSAYGVERASEVLDIQGDGHA